MSPLILQTDAQADFRDAIAFYETRESGLGEEFRIAAVAAFRDIAAKPVAFPPHT